MLKHAVTVLIFVLNTLQLNVLHKRLVAGFELSGSLRPTADIQSQAIELSNIYSGKEGYIQVVIPAFGLIIQLQGIFIPVNNKL